MRPILFTIPFLPEGWGEIKSYGFMLMIGFLSAIWLACRRAQRVQADPDVVLNIGLIALLAGVVGARAYFVIHYWEGEFANQPNPWLAVMRIDRGGMEFWGGPILAIPAIMFYLWRAKLSIRWYVDIVAPSLMWGLAFGRIGCFMNGCCWGGVCVDPSDPEHQRAGLPWAIRFPYQSPAMMQQYWFKQMTVPAELIVTDRLGESYLLPRELLNSPDEKLRGPPRRLEKAEEQLALLRKVADDAAIKKQEAVVAAAKKEADAATQTFEPVRYAAAASGLSASELRDLASHYRSLPVQPTQLYGVLNALLISWVLGLLFLRRERHGIVFGWMLILKALTRFLLELVRQDNPLDTFGLSLSQSVCIVMFLFGVVFLLWMRKLPLKSPMVRRFVPPEDDAEMPVARPARA